MRILITGGCGFVGSNLALQAMQDGNDVQIIDNLYRIGSEINLSWLRDQGKFIFREIDISNTDVVERAMSEFLPDAVFHMAGQVAMTTSIEDPLFDFRTNALGTLNVLEAVRKHCPGSLVVYSSTNKVYGDLEYIELDETDTRYIARAYPRGFDETLNLDFRSPYGCSKGCADQYMLDYHKIYGLNTVVFRHSSIYGGRQFSNFDQGWIGWFCRNAMKTTSDPGHSFTISGTGKQVRDVLFAEDLVKAYFRVLRKSDHISGEVFNLGGGMDNSLSLLELFQLLEKKLGIKMNYQETPWRSSDQKVFVADNAKAKSLLGWEPKIDKDTGLDLMLQWTKDMKGYCEDAE